MSKRRPGNGIKRCGGETWKRHTAALLIVSVLLLFCSCAVKCHFIFQTKIQPEDDYVNWRAAFISYSLKMYSSKNILREFRGRGSCDTWMLVLPNWSVADSLKLNCRGGGRKSKQIISVYLDCLWDVVISKVATGCILFMLISTFLWLNPHHAILDLQLGIWACRFFF